MIALLAKNPPQAHDVEVVELAVTRWRAFGIDESLALQESDLRDRHVGELTLQERQHLSDRQMTLLVSR